MYFSLMIAWISIFSSFRIGNFWFCWYFLFAHFLFHYIKSTLLINFQRVHLNIEFNWVAPNWNGLPWWFRWWRICLECRRPQFDLWVGKIPWRKAWQPTPVLLPGEPIDRGAWWATVHAVTKSQTRLSY